MAKEDLPKQVGHCDKCDGTDVECRVWYHVNEEFIPNEITHDDNDDTWCNTCEEHNGITYKPK